MIDDEDSEDEQEAQDTGFVSAMLKAQSQKEKREKAAEINPNIRSTKHIAPTSNICERLFSRAKLVMSAQRRLMDPSTLETILLLRYNHDLWDASTVDMVRKRDARERAEEREREKKRREEIFRDSTSSPQRDQEADDTTDFYF